MHPTSKSTAVRTTNRGARPHKVRARSLLTSGDVAAILGLTHEGVRYLDAELRPKRAECGCRLYDPEIVAAVAQKRGAL